MVKLEAIKPVVRSSSSTSSDDSDYDDIHSISSSSSSSSSDSDLSLIETSTINSSKSYQKRSIPTSVHIIPQGTLIYDINNNPWILHQCIKISKTHDKFLYLCSQMKKSPTINAMKISEDNLIKTKISPLINLTEKFHQSRQTIIDKISLENAKLDYIFYGTILLESTKEIQFIFSNQTPHFPEFNSNKILHGMIEFFQDDENSMKKYSIEICSIQEKFYSSNLFEEILKKEIEHLKILRKTQRKIAEHFHQYLIQKNLKTSQYNIQQIPNDQFEYLSTMKYLLKLELTPSSKSYTIDQEISFYSRFATHEKLKSYIKRHNLMYIAIPEYISHGIYKHRNLIYQFLIMEQYRENLRSLIYSYDQSLPEHNALNLFLQMLYVIQFLHEKNYVHQIIKPKYLMFANKQPYFIFLTQFRTIENLQEINENPKENFQLKKKVKHSHRTQLAAIHNKTLLHRIDIPNPIIEDENFQIHSSTYYHPFSVYSSLDRHLNNKQTYRGDLEMLGYNLIVWSGGRLPWEKKNSNMKLKFQHLTIINEKKLAKSNVNEFVKKCFFMKLISPVTLRAICDYMSTIYQLNIDDMPNFDQLRAPIKEIVKALGFKANACLRLSNSKSKAVNVANNQTQVVKNSGNIEKHININETTSPAKELEVEQDDLEDEEEEEDDDDDDDDEEEEETHPCPPESSLCEDDDGNSSTDDDTPMEEQIPLVPGQSLNSKCQRCGGDHSLEDQQSQTSSNNNNLNTLTYQQKRQRSIAKRLQLRRKKKN